MTSSDSQFQHRNLPHLLLRGRETMMAYFRPILKAAGLTDQQWRIYRMLDARGSMEPNQLARACLILSPSLTRMLSAMEATGMIQRTPSSTDQRRQMISLTAKSRALIARIKPQIDMRYQHLDQLLGTANLQALCQAVDTAVAIMEADMQHVEGRWNGELP